MDIRSTVPRGSFGNSGASESMHKTMARILVRMSRTAEEAGRKIQEKYPVNIVGYDSPRVSTDKGSDQNEPILRKVREA